MLGNNLRRVSATWRGAFNCAPFSLYVVAGPGPTESTTLVPHRCRQLVHPGFRIHQSDVKATNPINVALTVHVTLLPHRSRGDTHVAVFSRSFLLASVGISMSRLYIALALSTWYVLLLIPTYTSTLVCSREVVGSRNREVLTRHVQNVRYGRWPWRGI